MSKTPIDKVLSTIKSEVRRKTCMEIAAIAVRMLKEHGYYFTYQMMVNDHTIFNESIVKNTVCIVLQRDIGRQLGWNPLAMMLAMIRRFVCVTSIVYRANPMMFLMFHKYGTEKYDEICNEIAFALDDEIRLKVKQMKSR